MVFYTPSNSKWLERYEFLKYMLTWQLLSGATWHRVPLALSLSLWVQFRHSKAMPDKLGPLVSLSEFFSLETQDSCTCSMDLKLGAPNCQWNGLQRTKPTQTLYLSLKTRALNAFEWFTSCELGSMNQGMRGSAVSATAHSKPDTNK